MTFIVHLGLSEMPSSTCYITQGTTGLKSNAIITPEGTTLFTQFKDSVKRNYNLQSTTICLFAKSVAYIVA